MLEERLVYGDTGTTVLHKLVEEALLHHGCGDATLVEAKL